MCLTLSHSVLGIDDPKPHHDRESDSDEAKTSDKFNDVTVVSGDDFKESQKRNASEDRSSSSRSSSEDDEVKVEKENSGQSSYSEATRSNETHETSAGCTPETRSSEIPVHLEVKEVTSLPQELNSATTDSAESHMEQNMTDILPLSDEQTRRDTESLLPKDSGVTTVDRDGIDGRCKESQKNISSEEKISSSLFCLLQGGNHHCSASKICMCNFPLIIHFLQPLVYTQPMPVPRTSWMNCCGLLDVLSGGSSR